MMARARKSRIPPIKVGDVVVFPYGPCIAKGRVVEARNTGPGGHDFLGVEVRTGVGKQVVRYEIVADAAKRANP
jgi:hypothetical protein